MIIENLHAAIEQRLAERLPGVEVASYPDLADRVSLPLLVLELSEFEDGSQPGTGELALIAHFQARLVVDPNSRGAELYVRQFAARVAAEVHFQMWGQPVGPARVTDVGPDGFRAELDGYLVWMVSWTHAIHVGEPDELTLPEPELLIGITPSAHPPDEYVRPIDLEFRP